MSETIALAEAHRLAVAALVAANTAPANAASVADALIAAEADGLPSHGLSRVAAYADQAKAGKVDGHAVPTLTATAPGTLLVDAKDGFAYPAIAAAIPRAAEMAKIAGTVAVGHQPIERRQQRGSPEERCVDRFERCCVDHP